MNEWNWVWDVAAETAGVSADDLRFTRGTQQVQDARRSMIVFMYRMGERQAAIADMTGRTEPAIHGALARARERGLLDAADGIIQALAWYYLARDGGTQDGHEKARRMVAEQYKPPASPVRSSTRPPSIPTGAASIVMASGATYRRDPVTREIIWGDQNEAFAKLMGRRR